MMSFSHARVLKIYLKEVSLQQIYNQLESEHFFTSDSKLFLQKSYATNSFTIGIRRNKMVAAQWHEVNQTEAKAELIIKSRYKNWFFAWADLREQAKAIEQELIIRYNFLLRKKPG